MNWRRRGGVGTAVAAMLTAMLGIAARAQDQQPAAALAETDALLDTLLREFEVRKDTAEPPWDRLRSALQAVRGPVDAGVLKQLQQFAMNMHPSPSREADVEAARAVWATLAQMSCLDQYRPYALLNGARLEYEAGDEAEAVRLWEATIAAAWWLRFNALEQLFYASEGWRDTAMALATLERARAVAPKDGIDRLRFDLMECHCCLRMGTFADAYEALHRAQARQGTEELTPADLEKLSLAELDLALETGDYPEAVRLAREALQADPSRNRAQLGLAIALGRCGTPSERQASMQQLESMIATALPRNRPFVLQELTELCLLAGHSEQAHELARKLVAGREWEQLTAPQRVAAIAGEMATGVEAIAPARRTELGEVLDALWSRLQVEWRAMPLGGNGVAFLQQKFRRNVLSLRFALELARGDADAARRCLQSYLAADALGSAARRANRTAPTPEQVQQLVDTDAVLLAYLPAEMGSFVFVVTRDAIELHRLPSSLAIEIDVPALRRDIHAAGAPSAELRRRLDDMAGNLLPASLHAQVRAAVTVTIVGRELCGGMPFECLPWADAAAPWLGLAKPIAYLPSLTIGTGLRRPAGDGDRDAPGNVRLLVGSPVAPRDAETWHVESLQLPAGWQRTIARPIAADSFELEQPARRRELLSAATPASFVGILAHGILDGARPRQNGVLLAADDDQGSGAIWPEDIETTAAPGRVVFLGVCGAAAGALKRGEDGSHHLGGALLHAGAEGVILSDHQVFLDTSLATLRALASALADGRSAAAALLDARRELWQQDHSLATLAAFRYEGLPDVRVALRPPPSSWLIALSAAAAGVAAAAVMIGRRRVRAAAPSRQA